MIKLEVDGQEFSIASSYEELTLGQYIDIIKQGEAKEQLGGNEADIRTIALLSNSPKELEKILWDFSIEDFKELVQHFEWVGNTAILEEFKAKTPKASIDVDGKQYTIQSNFNKITLGEQVSYETMVAKSQSDFHPLEIAFGILLRPIGEDNKPVKFSEEVFLEVIKNKYKVNMMDVYGTIAFFLHGEKTSTKSTSRFSVVKL